MTSVLYSTTVCLLFWCLFHPLVSGAEPWCATPDSTEGECVSIDNCTLLKEIEITNATKEKLKLLKQSQCGYVNDIPQVCCEVSKNYKKFEAKNPHQVTITLHDRFSPVLPTPSNTLENECGQQSDDNRIVGGTITSIDEFPWAALLKYKTPLGSAALCGGVLISKRHVLTAGHCVKGGQLSKVATLENVTLGEYDLSTATDCDIEWDECFNQSIDVRIQSVHAHPLYNPASTNRHHDIALLKLMESVEFTDFIRPICLPTPAIEEKAIVGKNFLFVTGWGSTKTEIQSKIKLKAKIPVNPFSTCSTLYKGKGINLMQNQLCAGGQRKDSCMGDSGGPLMYLDINGAKLQWHLIGVISFGYKNCGTEDIPSIYTKVVPYIPWINDIMNK